MVFDALGLVGALLLGPPVISKTYAVVPQIGFGVVVAGQPWSGAGIGLVLVNVLLWLGVIAAVLIGGRCSGTRLRESEEALPAAMPG